MASIRKGTRISLLILAAVMLLAQAFRIDKTNPPVQSDISTNSEAHALLRRACYNCHSSETVWPWYSNVAPVSWLLASDVQEGRGHVNFSEWGTYSSAVQSHKLAAIAEEVRGGEMPPWYYALLHAEARLGTAERTSIADWAETSSQAPR
ncbi:MAG: heme-binding protein [Acidobacteria bacterium]|jgi:hypothetical protein|nr:heme-binding protein [Acidobacteriota bacterium]